MIEVITIYYCPNMANTKGRCSCSAVVDKKLTILYCADHKCNRECGIPDYLACTCYKHTYITHSYVK